MQAHKIFNFNNATYSTQFCYSGVNSIQQIVNSENLIFVTDSNVFNCYPDLFKNKKCIVIAAGEDNKNENTLHSIITQLINFNADRSTFLVGIGGGLVSDITGYAASIYMRGVNFGFVPTTLLAMVDASIGGKNGISFGLYKNMLGIIRQPQFILFDETFLQTLPKEEWVNGFAEIIKYGCIKQKDLFEDLAKNNLNYYRTNVLTTAKIIAQCAELKMQIVVADEHEKGERKLLNFGHTFAHAIEKMYDLPHGEAVAIGMVKAAEISEKIAGFNQKQTLIDVIAQYELPIEIEYDKEKVLQLMMMDKKKDNASVNYILLQTIGDAEIRKISFEELSQFF